MVSSSSQEPRVASIAIQTPSKLLKELVREQAGSSKASKEEYRQMSEKVLTKSHIFLEFSRVFSMFQMKTMRADFDQEKKRAVNVATRSLERDLERLKADHATEVEELLEKHRQEVKEMKKKQWVSFTNF